MAKNLVKDESFWREVTTRTMATLFAAGFVALIGLATGVFSTEWRDVAITAVAGIVGAPGGLLASQKWFIGPLENGNDSAFRAFFTKLVAAALTTGLAMALAFVALLIW